MRAEGEPPAREVADLVPAEVPEAPPRQIQLPRVPLAGERAHEKDERGDSSRLERGDRAIEEHAVAVVEGEKNLAARRFPPPVEGVEKGRLVDEAESRLEERVDLALEALRAAPTSRRARSRSPCGTRARGESSRGSIASVGADER